MMKHHYKKIIPLFLVSLAAVAPLRAYAAFGIPDLDDIFGFFIRAISFVVFAVFGTGLAVAGSLVDFTFRLNRTILGGPESIVQIGWQIVRDIANLGFVLAIIIIAFAIILRFKEYGSQQLLVRLIAAAILVNFSLAIGGFFIDFSNVITSFFLENRLGVGDSFEISKNIAGAFGVQRFSVEGGGLSAGGIPLPILEEGRLDGLGGVTTAVLGVFFSIVFLSLAIIVFLAFAVMLLIRFVYLTILLIISPIVWLFWVIPGFKGNFGRWWSKFISWVFFAPALSFFIYLTLISAEQLGSEPFAMAGGGVVASIVSQGGQMVALVGLLLGGLIAAQSMGIHGAAAGMKAAKGLIGGAKSWAGYRTGRAGRGIGRKITESKAGQRAGSALAGIGRGLETKDSDSKFTTGMKRLTKGTFKVAAKPFKEAGQAVTKKGLEKPTTLSGFMLKGARSGYGWKTKDEKSKYSSMEEDKLRDLMDERGIPVEEGDDKKYMIEALNDYDRKTRQGERRKREERREDPDLGSSEPPGGDTDRFGDIDI